MLKYAIILIVSIYIIYNIFSKLIAWDAGNWIWTVEVGACSAYEKIKIPEKLKKKYKIKSYDFEVYRVTYEIYDNKQIKSVVVEDMIFVEPIIGSQQDISVQWGFGKKIIKGVIGENKFYKFERYVRRTFSSTALALTFCGISYGIDFGIKKLLEIEAVQEMMPMIEEYANMIVEIFTH